MLEWVKVQTGAWHNGGSGNLPCLHLLLHQIICGGASAACQALHNTTTAGTGAVCIHSKTGSRRPVWHEENYVWGMLMGSLCFEGASHSTLLFSPLRPCFGITRVGLFFTLKLANTEKIFTCGLGGIFASKVSVSSYPHHYSFRKRMKFTESQL